MTEETEVQATTSSACASSDNSDNVDQNNNKQNKNKKTSTPPEGYVCNLCGISGHWIQQCTQADKHKKRKRKKSASSNHEYQVGIDPSPKDIERARQMQQIPPPNCDCGIRSRLKKVKKSRVNPENSRAVGSYFFFCSKARDDPTKCNFATPVDEIDQKTKGEKKQSNFFANKRHYDANNKKRKTVSSSS